jgi:predicted nucleic acid-binding protein
VTLTDAGALVALVDKNQPQNARCRATFAVLSLPLITVWPAFTEAMYLVYQIGGWPLQRHVWSYVEEGILQSHSSTAAEQARMRQLMEQYRDTPMDLADASLVAAAEVLNLRRIFTLSTTLACLRWPLDGRPCPLTRLMASHTPSEEQQGHHAGGADCDAEHSSASSALASCKSAVSKPSVNQP